MFVPVTITTVHIVGILLLSHCDRPLCCATAITCSSQQLQAYRLLKLLSSHQMRINLSVISK